MYCDVLIYFVGNLKSKIYDTQPNSLKDLGNSTKNKKYLPIFSTMFENDMFHTW